MPPKAKKTKKELEEEKSNTYLTQISHIILRQMFLTKFYYRKTRGRKAHPGRAREKAP